MTDYHDVKAIVQRLLTAGVQPSRKRVRRELGDQGSYQTLGTMIDQATAELGHPPQAGAAPDAGDTPEPPPSDPGEAALRAALDCLAAAMATVQDLDGVAEPGARWLYRQRLARLDWSGMTEVQRLVNTPEGYGRLIGQLREQSQAFLRAAARLHRALQRDYAGLQAEERDADDERPPA
jgi:hypothetical protein